MRARVIEITLGALLLLDLGLPAGAQTPSSLQLLVGHVPEPAEVGSDLSIAVDVSNAGPGDANGVQLVVRFPNADAVLASAQAGQGSCSQTAPGEVTCGVGYLAEGAAVSARLVVTPVTASTLSTSAEADTDEEATAAGTDEVKVDGRSCDVVGTQGDDTLAAESPGDVVCGLGGNDALTGLDGDETLYGGSGDDILGGGSGNDSLEGGEGVDAATYASASTGIRADLQEGNVVLGADTHVLTGVENIIGSPHDDWISGSTGPNRILGGDGLDLSWGGDGDDILLGEGGDDYLNGGPGVDDLDGGSGADTCARENGTLVRCRLVSPDDLNDTAGRMDVKQIRTAFGTTTSTWRFVTFARWKIRGIWDEGFALVYLDTAGNADAEYRILARVRSNGRGLTASLQRLGNGRRWRLDAWHPALRILAVRLPMSRISFEAGRSYYRWWGKTLFSRSSCKHAVCIDSTPGAGEAGSLIQPLP